MKAEYVKYDGTYPLCVGDILTLPSLRSELHIMRVQDNKCTYKFRGVPESEFVTMTCVIGWLLMSRKPKTYKQIFMDSLT